MNAAATCFTATYGLFEQTTGEWDGKGLQTWKKRERVCVCLREIDRVCVYESESEWVSEWVSESERERKLQTKVFIDPRLPKILFLFPTILFAFV